MQDAAWRHARDLSCWSGPVDPLPLAGGLSNTNFTVEDGGRRFVVRIGGDVPEHGVWRFNEISVSAAAHRAGLAPSVVHHENGVLVLEYVESGRTLDPDMAKAPSMLPRIVELIRHCHHELPNFLDVPGPMFWVFHVNRRYGRMIREGDGRWRDKLPDWLELNAEFEKAVGPIEPVFCHNDLIAANLIDDGRRLWLIDWEYGAWNSALFDLANLATNNSFSDGQEDRLLTLYFGEAPDAALLRRFSAMKAASLLRETLWGLVSETHSRLDIDYPAYTNYNAARFEAALRSYKSHL